VMRFTATSAMIPAAPDGWQQKETLHCPPPSYCIHFAQKNLVEIPLRPSHGALSNDNTPLAATFLVSPRYDLTSGDGWSASPS